MSVPPQMRTVPTIILFLIFFFRRTLPKMMFVTNCIDSNGASMTEGAKAYDAKFSKAPVTKTAVPITQVRDSLGSRAGFSASSLPPLSSSSSSSRFCNSFKPMDCKLLPVLMAIEPNRPRTNPSAMDHNGNSTVSRSSSVKTGWLGAAVGAPVDAMAAGPGGHRAASADARPTVRAASAARRGRWLPGGAGLRAGLPGAAQATVVASRRGQAWRSLALRSRGCELPAFRTLGPPVVGLLGLTLAKPPHAPARPRGESSGRAA